MARCQILQHCETSLFSKSTKSGTPSAAGLLRAAQGSALLEFAITLPLLVVFVVGIYDFSGAFNQKQKIEQAAQEGAIVAGAQPMGDIQSIAGSNPSSLQPVVTAVVNSLTGSGVATGNCGSPPFLPSGPSGLAWTYTILGCSGAYPTDTLVIVVNRGWVCPAPCSTGPPVAVGTIVSITYPYHWTFNRVIQLLIPGANYAGITQLTESATVHNQM
jgi:hypothetical protein